MAASILILLQAQGFSAFPWSNAQPPNQPATLSGTTGGALPFAASSGFSPLQLPQGPLQDAVESLQAKQARLEQDRQKKEQAERHRLEQERLQRQQQLQQQQEAQERRSQAPSLMHWPAFQLCKSCCLHVMHRWTMGLTSKVCTAAGTVLMMLRCHHGNTWLQHTPPPPTPPFRHPLLIVAHTQLTVAPSLHPPYSCSSIYLSPFPLSCCIHLPFNPPHTLSPPPTPATPMMHRS